MPLIQDTEDCALEAIAIVGIGSARRVLASPRRRRRPPTSGQPVPMQDMSDDEADHIVVAMAGPHGPLGDAFEVDAAARAPAPAPTTPPPTAAAASASDAAPAPAPANNTRLVRVKAQLCRLWRVAPTVLDAAFDSRSRDFFAKLCRLAQMPNVDFGTAHVELSRARLARIHGTAIDLPLRGVSRDRAWAPSDVDRAIEALGGAAARPAVSAVPAAPAAPAAPAVTVTVVPAAASVRKRTAAETPAETPHKRQRSSASGTSGASTAYAESSRGIPIDPDLENETGYESDRASVPRAASIERELERRQQNQQEPRPQHRATEGQTTRVQTPAQQDSTRPQRADPLPAHATGNGVPPPTPGKTPMGSFDDTEDCVSAPAVLSEKAVRAAVKDSQYDRSEALRRLESCETLPPLVFHQLLQDFCCAK
ncbi:hypothetical protein GTA08_BOTSDO12570 [Neofusicoccum parvum]|uniref:Uncharacterized protein n=1 Tax=Neofusicoccum parvum TaxID=310453 RepID=A0ACB5SJR8_9PEZI|nr:hypothetical protein GTA08_BOTSDO12570 [Neofusicoccum parvum]